MRGHESRNVDLIFPPPPYQNESVVVFAFLIYAIVLVRAIMRRITRDLTVKQCSFSFIIEYLVNDFFSNICPFIKIKISHLCLMLNNLQESIKIFKFLYRFSTVNHLY